MYTPSTGIPERFFWFFLLLFLFSSAIFSQVPDKQKKVTIYESTLIFSFDEAGTFGVKPEGSIFYTVLDNFPAPRSRKYLSVRSYGIQNESISILFPKPLEITDHISEVSVWIHGFFLPVEAYLILMDTDNKRVYIPLGNLKYRGWKRLSASIPEGFHQEDLYLKHNNPVAIIGFHFVPVSEKRQKRCFMFWLDQLEVKTRKRYLLPPGY